MVINNKIKQKKEDGGKCRSPLLLHDNVQVHET